MRVHARADISRGARTGPRAVRRRAASARRKGPFGPLRALRIVRPMKRAQPGFTLLELMVVLAIVGILMAIAIPAMGDFIRNGRITAAANDVMAALHFTRSEAIKRRQPVTLCTSTNALDADNTANDAATCEDSEVITGWIVFVDLNQDGAARCGRTCCSTAAHEPADHGSVLRGSVPGDVPAERLRAQPERREHRPLRRAGQRAFGRRAVLSSRHPGLGDRAGPA